MDELLAMIREGESLEFLALFASLETKNEMITTFLALLELIRLKQVRVYQRGMFGPIRVFRPVGPVTDHREAAGAPERMIRSVPEPARASDGIRQQNTGERDSARHVPDGS